MARASWKIQYLNKFMFKYAEEEKEYPKNLAISPMIKIYARNSCVTSILLGHKFGIHTGRGFSRVTIAESHVGLKVGALVTTKNIGMSMHLYNKVQKKKKKKKRTLKQKKINRNKKKKETDRKKKKQRKKIKKKKEI